MADVRSQRVRGAGIVPPEREEPARGHDVSRVLHERVEDPKLGRRQASDVRALLDLVTLGIETQIRQLEPRLSLLAHSTVGPPEDRADPKGELLELVGLCDEVVGAELEAAVRVGSTVRSAHDEDWRLVLGPD